MIQPFTFPAPVTGTMARVLYRVIKKKLVGKERPSKRGKISHTIFDQPFRTLLWAGTFNYMISWNKTMQILKPFKIKSLCFQNRVVMAPMVPFGIAELPSEEMSEELARHYIDRAENRMRLLILQALSVAPAEIYRDGIGIYHTGIYSETKSHASPVTGSLIYRKT